MCTPLGNTVTQDARRHQPGLQGRSAACAWLNTRGCCWLPGLGKYSSVCRISTSRSCSGRKERGVIAFLLQVSKPTLELDWKFA